MAAGLVAETTFLIDLERERRREANGPAHRFLAGHAADRFYVTFTVAGELAAGANLADRSAWEEFLAPFHVLPATPEVCWEYGRAFLHLQRTGQLIGANDLWIAATAVAHGLPVVTANAEHYHRVPGLEVVTYRP